VKNAVGFSVYWARFLQTPGLDGPIVRWGIVGMIAIMFWSVMLDPWADELDARRELLSSRTMELARLQALQSRVDAWRQAEQAFAQATVQTSHTLLQKASATAAQSELQGILQAILSRHHLKLESRHFMPLADATGVGKRVSVMLRLLGSTADAYQFLATVAQHKRVLVIEKLNMRRRRSGDVEMSVQVAAFMVAQEVAAQEGVAQEVNQ